MKKKKNDYNYPMFPEEYVDTAMEDNEKEGGEEQWASDEPDDGLGRVISDAKRECDTEKEKLKLEAMLEDHKKLLSQIAKMAAQSSLPHWNCWNGRQRLVYLTRDLRSYWK